MDDEAHPRSGSLVVDLHPKRETIAVLLYVRGTSSWVDPRWSAVIISWHSAGRLVSGLMEHDWFRGGRRARVW